MSTLAGEVHGRRRRRAKTKPPVAYARGGFEGCKSLTMTYFHTGIRTIIGADSFHCPVRDGKEWYQIAMVIRHKGVLCWNLGQHNEFIEFGIRFQSFDSAFQLFLNASTWHNIP